MVLFMLNLKEKHFIQHEALKRNFQGKEKEEEEEVKAIKNKDFNL